MPLGVVRVILPGCHRLWRAVPGRFGLASYSHVAVPQPQRCKHPWFGLVPVRSPLLGGSRLLSLPPGTEMFQRSEEHTSELQSRLHLVCRLLLEKKKKLSVGGNS